VSKNSTPVAPPKQPALTRELIGGALAALEECRTFLGSRYIYFTVSQTEAWFGGKEAAMATALDLLPPLARALDLAKCDPATSRNLRKLGYVIYGDRRPNNIYLDWSEADFYALWHDVRVDLERIADDLLIAQQAAPPSTSPPPNGEEQPEGEKTPASQEMPPNWDDLGEAKRNILEALSKLKDRLKNRALAPKAGYDPDSLRRHYGDLKGWGYIDHTKDGYAITAAGRAIVPPQSV